MELDWTRNYQANCTIGLLVGGESGPPAFPTTSPIPEAAALNVVLQGINEHLFPYTFPIVAWQLKGACS